MARRLSQRTSTAASLGAAGRSQANTNPPRSDVVNTQKQGAYLQGKLNIQLNTQHALSPYVRYTGLGDSDMVDNAYEPASQRWQLGVVWQFKSR